MKIPVKQLKNGFALPVYGLGLWQVGGRAEADYSRDAEEIDALQAAAAEGITHFDTAEQYADGHSEELLGAAIAGLDRKSLTIATKVSAWNQRYDDLSRSLDASLKRMKTDYVDLYMLHRFPEAGTPIGETVKALNDAVRSGRVLHIGACNLSVNRFDYLQSRLDYPLVCNQLHYNVKYREPESSGLLKYSQDNDVMLVAWRPLQKGSLPETDLISLLADKYGKTPVQVMINWLISQPNVVTIAKTSKLEHLKENLGAVGWRMDAEDIERIRAEYPNQCPISDAVPLDYVADVPV